jgi:hypothetical protein
MNPNIGKRSKYNSTEEKEKTLIVKFIEMNTKKNITMRQEYLYLEDVKKAINICTLEERRKTKLQVLSMIKKNPNLQQVIKSLEESADMDRHRLIKFM